MMNATVERMLREETSSPNDPSASALRAAQNRASTGTIGKPNTSITFTQTTENPMPVFAIRDLSVLAYASGFTLWHYKSLKGRLADITTGNYFADAANMMTVGDMVVISAADGGRIVVVALADVETVVLAPLS